MVDRLENLDVEFLSGGGIKRHAQSHKSISKTLDSDTNRPMTHVRATSLRDGIEVDINDSIKVICNNFGDVV
jgi:hypothetical protein